MRVRKQRTGQSGSVPGSRRECAHADQNIYTLVYIKKPQQSQTSGWGLPAPVLLLLLLLLDDCYLYACMSACVFFSPRNQGWATNWLLDGLAISKGAYK